MIDDQQIPLELRIEIPIEPDQPITLPPYTGSARCPKCGNGSVRALYHDFVGNEYTVCGREIRRIWRETGRYGTAFGQHLDRRCTGCRAQWVEAVATPEQIAEMGSLDAQVAMTPASSGES